MCDVQHCIAVDCGLRQINRHNNNIARNPLLVTNKPYKYDWAHVSIFYEQDIKNFLNSIPFITFNCPYGRIEKSSSHLMKLVFNYCYAYLCNMPV